MAKKDASRRKESSSGKHAAPRAGSGVVRAHVSDITARKQPRQARARETVAAILEAAAELIAADGFGRTSTNRIAARAGVSIGSLYQYFPNKEAIRQQLVVRHREQIAGIIEGALQRIEDPALPFADGLRSLFEGLVAMHQENPALIRALAADLPRVDWPAGERSSETRPYVRRMEATLRARSEPAFADPAAAAWVAVWAIEALTRTISHDAPSDVDPSRLVDEALAMITGYVRVAP